MKELVKPEIVADGVEDLYEAYGGDCCREDCCDCNRRVFRSDDPIDDILF